MKPLRPEHEILVCVSRRTLGPYETSRLRALVTPDLDWEYLLATARHHGLIPLLHDHANISAGDTIPPYFRSALKRESVMNRQSVLHLTSRTLKLTNIFRQHNIQYALFKGAVLAELVYGDIGLRQAGDIDLLIRRADFAHAKALLQTLGYQMQPELTSANLSSHLRNHCEIQFMRDDWFTVVDLHWGLTPRSFVFGLTGDEVMSRLQTVSFASTEIATFSTEDSVLYHAMHGAKHLWRRLEWIASLAELARSLEETAWSEVVARAEKARATRILALGLHLVAKLGVELPERVLRSLDTEEGMKALANKLWTEMFSTSPSADSTETNLFNLKIMDRRRDALLSTLRAIFVPTLSDWQAWSLPAAMSPLYYAFRPLRLTKVYSASLIRRVIR